MPADSRTNNAAERPRPTAWLLAALLAVAVLRLWRLPEAGPPDFDSVRNWQVVRELGQGNFAHLFHHGSPGFLLLFAPVAVVAQQFLVFQGLNALLGVAGLGWVLLELVAQVAHIDAQVVVALDRIGAPHLAQQLAVGEHAAFVRQQGAQQAVFDGGEVQGLV